jgi:glycosyltransferase involved in cell wall biosynthesis
MSGVTIGVPVYNGADLLHEALANLANQSFGDFKVLIYDNASTDGTEAIARSWVARDPRFHYVRQPENVGALRNFLAPLLAADTRWFMWRAHDDLSATDYLEVLHALATTTPGCKLAVGNILTRDLDGGRRKDHHPPRQSRPGSLSDSLNLLLKCHPSWFYGLWDRETLIRAYRPVCEGFPYAFASDHLTIYGPIIRGEVRTTTATTFVQRYRRTAVTPRGGTRMPYATMAIVRKAFRRELQRIRAECNLPAGHAAVLRASEMAYLHHTLPSLLKMARTRLREKLGLAKAREASRHISADA